MEDNADMQAPECGERCCALSECPTQYHASVATGLLGLRLSGQEARMLGMVVHAAD